MKIKLVKAEKKMSDLIKAYALYKRAFPKNEQAPFFLLAANTFKYHTDFRFIYAADEWAGLLYTVHYRDLSYVFYFAVEEKMRGKGVGTSVLKAAKKAYSGRRLFLAIEPVEESARNYRERVDRRNFYMRCGFMPTGHRLREGNMIYELLSAGGEVSSAEYGALMRSYMGDFLADRIRLEIID